MTVCLPVSKVSLPLLMLILLLVIPGSLVPRLAQAADAVPGEEYCNGPVTRIGFRGNRKTRAGVLQRQVSQLPGAPCSLDDIVDSVQSIMDLRLFKRTAAVIERQGSDLVVIFEVVEKIYFVPLPRLSRTSDGELRLGLQLRWDNFAGLAHKVRVTSEKRQEEDGRGRDGHRHSIDYSVPRFFGSDYGMSFGLQHLSKQSELEMDDTVFGEAVRIDNSARIQMSRWTNTRGVTEGLRYKYGLSVQYREYDDLQGDLGPFEEGRDLFANVGFEYRGVRDDLLRLRGRVFGLDFRWSTEALGSDYEYNRTDFYFRRYKAIDRTGLQNFNYQLRFGYSNGGPFGERHYQLGGGNNLRGLEARSKSGDVMALLNAELLTAFENYQVLRWVLFADVGNVYRHNNIQPLKQKLGFGAGLRWKLLAVSNTDLRLDAAWDMENDDLRYYVTTNLTF